MDSEIFNKIKNGETLKVKLKDHEKQFESDFYFLDDDIFINIVYEMDDLSLFKGGEFSLSFCFSKSLIKITEESNDFNKGVLKGKVCFLDYGFCRDYDSTEYFIKGLDGLNTDYQYNWDRKFIVDNNEYTLSFSHSKDSVIVRHPKLISDELIGFIDDEVSLVCLLHTFCLSTKVHWISRKLLNSNEVVGWKYVNFKVIDSPNLLSPMRMNVGFTEKFVIHCINNGIDRGFLDRNGIFQAIENLQWKNILNEWFMISHVAAIEGICKSEEINVLSEVNYKDIRRSIKSKIISEGERLSIKVDDLNLIYSNICNCDRIINGFPTKFYVEKKFKELGLSNYYSDIKPSIDKIINMRNVIVHEGWKKHWDKSLYSCTYELRNLLYILIFSMVKFEGCFYLVEIKEPIKLGDIKDCI